MKKTVLCLFLVASFAASTSSSPTIIDFPNAEVLLSPYAWRIDGSNAAINPTGGGYIKFSVTGTTSIVVNVDTTVNNGLSANDMPSLKVIVNSPTLDGAAAYVQFPANNTASTPVTLATGMNAGITYNVILSSIGGNHNGGGNCWSGTACAARILSLQFDSGANVTPSPQRPRNCVFWGDSYLLAYFGAAETGAYYTYVDFTLSWPFSTAFAMNCEYGQIGVGSQGWVRGGEGGYPNFAGGWNGYDSSHAKTFSPAPDFAVIAEGINDHDESSATVQANVTSTITAMRTAFGAATKIFVVIPINHQQIAAIEAGVVAAADPKTFVIDMGTQYLNTVFAGASTWASPDGLHLSSTYQALIGNAVTQGIQFSLSPSSSLSGQFGLSGQAVIQ